MTGHNDTDDDQLRQLRRRQVGARVRALRLVQGLSQTQLAILAGTTRGRVSALETQGHNITLDTLLGLADGLGVHPSRLLDDRLFKLQALVEQFPAEPDTDTPDGSV